MIKGFFLIIFLTSLSYSFAYDDSSYYIEETYSDYIQYLIVSGKLDITHPLNQPYTIQQILFALERDSILISTDYRALKLYENLKKRNIKQTDNGRLILGSEAEIKLDKEDNSINDYYSISIITNYNYKNFVACYEYEADTENLDDSLYFGSIGKLQKEVFGRAANAYLKYSTEYFNLFFGRLDRNYGVNNHYSLIRSNNPHSYDHFNFELYNDLLKYSFSMSRLEDKYAFDVRDSLLTYEWCKRYISFHRLELSFSDNVKLALTESILYGGKDQTIIPFYINPFNVFFFSKMSDRKGLEEGEANVLISTEIFIRLRKNLSFYTQFLIDDMDFTKELREQFPDRIGISSRLTLIDLYPKSEMSLSYIRISNWTYNSFYTFGNYTFHGKSLGYPQNGLENISLDFNLFYFPKFSYNFQMQFQREREQDLESPFIAEKIGFPVGISQNSFMISGGVYYLPNTNIVAKLDLGYDFINNYNNQKEINKNLYHISLLIKIKGFLNFLELN